MSASPDLSQNMLDRIRHDQVGLKMPRELEPLDQIVRRLRIGLPIQILDVEQTWLQESEAVQSPPDL